MPEFEKAVPFPGLRHEELGIFTTAECVELYNRKCAEGLPTEKAVRAIKEEKHCTLCLVIEVLLNAGIMLSPRWNALADIAPLCREATEEELQNDDREIAQEAERYPEWARPYIRLETVAQKRRWIKEQAFIRHCSAYEVADELIHSGMAVPKTMTRQYLEMRKIWGHKGGIAGGEAQRKAAEKRRQERENAEKKE